MKGKTNRFDTEQSQPPKKEGILFKDNSKEPTTEMQSPVSPVSFKRALIFDESGPAIGPLPNIEGVNRKMMQLKSVNVNKRERDKNSRDWR